MQKADIVKNVVSILEDIKAKEIEVIDVSERSNVTDYMIICSGTSKKHVMSIASEVVDQVKQDDIVPIGSEGQKGGDWVLVDLSDIIVHVLTTEAREFYDLEKLWKFDPQSDVLEEQTA